MQNFLKLLLITSLSGSVALLPILLLLYPPKARAGIRLQKTAVVIALLLFLIPFAAIPMPQLRAPAPAANPAQVAPVPDATVETPILSTLLSGGERIAAGIESAIAPAVSPAEPAATVRPAVLLAALYGAGLLISIGVWAVRGGRYFRKLRRLSRGAAEPVQRRYRAICAEMSVAKPPELRVCDTLSTPILYGLFRPVIVLPTAITADSAMLALAVRHELAHGQKKHLLFKYTALLVQIVHWFNPLALLLKRAVSQFAETECDAQVTAQFSARERAQYARTLLFCTPAAAVPGAVALSASARSIKSRIAKILNPRTPSRVVQTVGIAAVTLALCAALLMGCGAAGTIPEPEANPDPAPPTEEAPAEPGETGSVEIDPWYKNPPDQDPLTPTEDIIAEAKASDVTADMSWPTGPYAMIPRGYIDGVHFAIDIAGEAGTCIYAAKPGRVVFVDKTDAGYGHYVVLDHGGEFETLYAHCDEILVETGDDVEQGQLIATMGATGNATGIHLHFETRYKTYRIPPEVLLEVP